MEDLNAAIAFISGVDVFVWTNGYAHRRTDLAWFAAFSDPLGFQFSFTIVHHYTVALVDVDKHLAVTEN